MTPRLALALADEVLFHDVVVVGSGVAGLSAALGSSHRSVSVLTKAELGGGSSSLWAQGGVAAALDPEDSPQLHSRDTVAAGAGLGELERIVELTTKGPDAIRQLIELGGRFDRGADGELALGREGAHSRRRILHAQGDATGAEMVRTLVAALRRRPEVQIHEEVFAHDLVLGEGRVIGVLARHPGGRVVFHRAAAVVLATGGFGQLFARTTNPREATGDGLAMAARAGAELADLELVQFHPTALDCAVDPLPLVTEALRGEGAILRDDLDQRFMPAIHPLAELAPRDVVARAIRARQEDGRQVFLDATEAIGAAFAERFPTVWRHCRAQGLDPRSQAIPVTPAAHYAMAGIAVDGTGRTSLAGLWACGEVTSSGVHGANRLASNSLLEALVYGEIVARDIDASSLPTPTLAGSRSEIVLREDLGGGAGGLRRDDLRQEIRDLMWRDVGLIRSRSGLERALTTLEEWGSGWVRQGPEVQNLWTLGRLVAAAGLAREESRGAHFRSDFPATDKGKARRLFWTYNGALAGFPLTAVAASDGAVRTRQIA